MKLTLALDYVDLKQVHCAYQQLPPVLRAKVSHAPAALLFFANPQYSSRLAARDSKFHIYALSHLLVLYKI